MALSTTESHENEKFQDISRLEAENARMLKEIEQMRELIAGWVLCLSLDWVDASKVGKQEAATLFSWWS